MSDSDLLIQLVNESERGGIKTCWLHSEDVDSYTRYFRMMLDQHYGSSGTHPSEQRLAEGEEYLRLVNSASRFSREVKVIFLG